MDSARWEQIQSLFHDAAGRPDPERQAFLEAACAGGSEMLAEVLTMLKADSRNTSLLDRGLSGAAYATVGSPLDAVSLREIGPYRLKELLGEGGMGVVWLAERADAGNLVAIKFLPHAGLSPARRERFASEIKMLAKLRHPYIARLYDAGTLDDGTPWFVMEYVEGVRLMEYCHATERPVAECLRLFRSVCEAVQYAHGQEIIHRDLKPSNILVERDGTPRLLDFGIARQLQGLDEPTDQTRQGLRFMSPDYAAPEWVHDGTVGFYTDVYSLGVMLYEMLTGRLPFARSSESPERTENLNATNDPEKPSAAARRLAGAPADGAGVSSLSKAAWSDLDVLCLNALHKDPQQRYPSVEALIRDIDHYLKGEPLEARPDTLQYRLGKFVRRNRRAVLATAAAFMLVVGLVVFFTVHLAKARNAALAEAARTRRIQHLMLNLLGAGDDQAAPSNDLRVVTLLDRSVQEASNLNSDPQTQVELYYTLGRMYQMLGNPQKADELLNLALNKAKTTLGPESPRVVDILAQIGALRADQGQFKDARRFAQEGLSLATRHLPADDDTVVEAKSAWGRVLAESGAYDQAIVVLKPLVQLRPSSEEGMYTLLESLTALGYADLNIGHYQESESLNQRALTLDRQLYGKSHPRVAFDLANIGSAELLQGRLAQSESTYREAIQMGKAWYGPEHPDIAAIESFLAQVLVHEGKYDEADAVLKDVLASQERAYGNNHAYVAFTLQAMAQLESRRGHFAAAEDDYRRGIAVDKALFGDKNYQTAIGRGNLADVFVKEHEYAKAEPILREVIKTLSEATSPSNPNVGAFQAMLGQALVGQRKYHEAEEHLIAGYTILTQHPGPDPLPLQRAREGLVAAYNALNQPEKAAKFRAELAANEPRKAEVASRQ